MYEKLKLIEKNRFFNWIQKNPKDRLKIQKEDIIKLNGPILIDWFHDANNENKFISKHNHVRTKNYFLNCH